MVSQLFRASGSLSQKLGARKQELLADETGPSCMPRQEAKRARFDSEPKADTPEGVEAPFEKSEEDTLLQKCNGVFTEELIRIEVFAGSARLSQAVTKVALQAMAIDHTISKAAKQHVVIMDLSKEHGIAELRGYIKANSSRIIWIHFAPPCGTASKARDRPLKKWAAQGFSVPGPLRSTARPDGLDNLSGANKARTEKANVLYEVVHELCYLAHQLHVAFTIENPWGSYFWITSPMKQLQSDVTIFEVRFHSCCHGGERDKGTMFWTNVQWFNPLALLCDGSHPHKPWTTVAHNKRLTFDTASEAAYPFVLVQRMAAIVKQTVLRAGAVDALDLQTQSDKPHHSLHRVVMGAFPRGKRLKPLLADFGECRIVLCAAQNTQPLDKHLESMPKGTAIVRRHIVEKGEVERACNGGALLLAEHGSFADDAVMEKIVLGVPRKPADFIQAAVQAGHPRSLAVTLNAVSEDAVVANRDWPVTDLIRARIDFLTYWMKRAQELEHAERTLHLSMPEYLQQVLRGKRILLMGEMLERLGFEDKYLQQDVSEGFKLTGWLRETGCFPKKIRKPTMPAPAVMAMASSVNQRIVKQMSETSFSETDAKAWDETLAELERGWIFRDDAPDLGKVLLAKRFGLAQKEKTRVIDDFSVGGLNSLAGLREKLAVQSIDEIAAHLAFVIDSKSSRSMGGVLGKTYDLTSAYKQYGVHPSDRDLARIAVKTPSHKLAFFGTNALPFGAVGSVGGFLRISAALRPQGAQAMVDEFL